jgi:hypothetical protein
MNLRLPVFIPVIPVCAGRGGEAGQIRARGLFAQNRAGRPEKQASCELEGSHSGYSGYLYYKTPFVT